MMPTSSKLFAAIGAMRLGCTVILHRAAMPREVRKVMARGGTREPARALQQLVSWCS